MIPGLGDGPLIPLMLILVALSILAGFRSRVIGGLARLLSLGVFAVALFLATGQRDKLEPYLGRVLGALEGNNQDVVGEEVRLRMAPDGHFWAEVSLDGVKRRMLVDSGATITAVSQETARRAGLLDDKPGIPMVIRTANGTVMARSGEVDELRLGNIKAGGLDVVVSPAFGNVDVLGMNFLSRLKSWRVEGRTLILTPHHPQPVGGKA